MNLILIAGHAGSGKTSIANYIKEIKPNTVCTLLSKYIKLFATEMLDWNGDEETKPRTFLQEMGDTLRSIDENYMTSRILQDIEVYKKYYDTVVVSDVRLINEIEYFKNQKDLNVISIYIKSESPKRDLTEKQRTHRTETELESYDKFDYVLENNFDNSLYERIKEIIEEEL